MIHIKYDLSRDERDEVVYFKNPLDAPLANHTIIRGDNSLGKSTILNIIAYGLFGLSNDRILPSLSKKMKILDDQDLTFDLEISRKDLDIKLISKKVAAGKRTFEVIEQRGSSQDTICKEVFEKDYNLIYDVPDQTFDRLKTSINDILDLQKRYGQSIRSFRDYVLETMKDIERSSDPEKLVGLGNQKQEAKRRLASLEGILEKEKKRIDTLWVFASCKFYHEYDSKFRDRIGTKEQLILRRDQLVKGMGKRTRARSKSEMTLETKKRELSDSKSKAVDDLVDALAGKRSGVLKDVKSIDIEASFERFGFSSETMDAIYSAKEVLGNIEKEENEKTQNLEEARVYSDLINILERYVSSSIRIPGVERTVSEFVQLLREANAKNEIFLKHLKDVKKAIESVGLLENAIIYANQALERAKEADSKDIPTERQALIQLNQYIVDINKESKEYDGKKSFYHSKLIENHIDPEESFRRYKEMEGSEEIADDKYLSEKALIRKIEELDKKCTDDFDEKAGIEKLISILDAKITEIEEAKPHKYQDRLPDIRRVLTITRSVDDTLNGGLKNYLEAISEKKPIDIESESNKKYHGAVSSYLGRRISSMKYQDSVLETESIDLIRNMISFKGGKRISLEYVSTGQSQCAYILNLLNTEDKRKMIVLVDEVGMISMNTLRPVFEKIMSLYKEGRLLACIIMKVSEDLKLIAEDIEEILTSTVAQVSEDKRLTA